MIERICQTCHLRIRPNYKNPNFCNSCALCNRHFFLQGEHRGQLDMHHIIYRSQGGPNFQWNKIKLCRSCHSKVHKSNKRKWQRRLLDILGGVGAFNKDVSVKNIAELPEFMQPKWYKIVLLLFAQDELVDNT